MRYFFLLGIYFFLLTYSIELKAQEVIQVNKNDSLTLAQAYINLKLTETYFDSLSIERISKILPFEESELAAIKDTAFITQNATLYNFTYSLLYLNKANLLFRTRKEINRTVLLDWFNTLSKAIDHFNTAKIDRYYTVEFIPNLYYELIKFDGRACHQLSGDIGYLKIQFTPYFNQDIYPDFQRVFYTAKNTKKFDFDSLSYYAGIFNISIDRAILENQANESGGYHSGPRNLTVEKEYMIDEKLDLISRYLQLKYIASDKDAKLPVDFNLKNLYDSYELFIEDLDTDNVSNKDEFFKKELNADVCNKLYKQLQNKFPYHYVYKEPGVKLGRGGPFFPPKVKYFFPTNPAPLPSAYKTIENYKPELKVLKQVDNYLSAILNKTGYKNQLHYYYALDGFALATTLEKFNTDGSNISPDNRWVKNMGSDEKFSYYEIFKSMFFETESEFRIFVFVVASKDVSVSDEVMSPGRAQELQKKSYPSLPDDLKDIPLPDKNLTILVYHFHTNEIGKTPELNISNKISVENYLKSAGLIEILK